MTYAYSELYLHGAQRILGDMFDFAVNTLHYSITEFHQMFIVSGMAHQFEIGNPTYIAGKNGCELAREVLLECGLKDPEEDDVMFLDKSQEYWIGWALAYYQWESRHRFVDIERCVPIDELYRMYPTLHEEDISSFSAIMNQRMKKSISSLRRLRFYANYSQSQLANISGVPLRQIQMFEQGHRDIRKTQGDTLKKLATALHCNIEELLI